MEETKFERKPRATLTKAMEGLWEGWGRVEEGWGGSDHLPIKTKLSDSIWQEVSS